MRPNCPTCNSTYVVKNGHIHNGKQNFICYDCNRQFVENPTQKIISQETKDLIDRLLLERIPLSGIARVTGVSGAWLQNYVNKKYGSVPKKVKVKTKKKKLLTIQCDEMWSFVVKKKNKQWIWLAIDVNSKEIVGVYVGSRDKKGAEGLWKSLPPVYRQCAVCYTDFWEAYEEIFPSTRHRAVSKKTGKTNYIERFNCTIRGLVTNNLPLLWRNFDQFTRNDEGAIAVAMRLKNDKVNCHNYHQEW